MRKDKSKCADKPSKKNCFGSPMIVYNCPDVCKDYIIKQKLKNYLTEKDLEEKFEDYITQSN